jgi:hypothetical protein
VVFNPQGERTQGHCNSVTFFDKSQGPPGVMGNDVQCSHRSDRSRI